MEQNNEIITRVEMPPRSRIELEIDILEQLCIWRKQNLAADENAICRHFDIAKKTLTAILKQMLEKGYVQSYEKNGEINLTPYGITAGNECLERHNAISQFLQAIGVTEETADHDACRVEHYLSEESVKALCIFMNSDMAIYERRIKKSELTDRYQPGKYEFMMQIYSMGQTRPREFREENFQYTGNIILEITEEEGWFELEYATEEKFMKKMWYKNDVEEDTGWIEAQRGKAGERIPASAFEYVVKAKEAVIEGSLMIAFTEEKEEPDFWNSCQLEIEIW